MTIVELGLEKMHIDMESTPIDRFTDFFQEEVSQYAAFFQDD